MDQDEPEARQPGPAETADSGDSGDTGDHHGVQTWQVIVGVVVLATLAVVIGVVIGRRSHTAAQVATETTETTSPATTTSSSASSTTVPADAGSWSLIPGGPTAAGDPMAWTGTELLVGKLGCCGDLGSADLSAYDPATDSWRQLPATPLTPRSGVAAAWTGTEMLVAGGGASPVGDVEHAAPAADGAAWNAATNTWHPIAPMPAPMAASVSVWTGEEMLVWSSATDRVVAYKPATDTWRTLPPSGLTPRHDEVAVWTGTELVVWGGFNDDATAAFGDGARLDPSTGTWRPLPAAPVRARGAAAAVWSGHEVLFWGGDSAVGGIGVDLVGQGAGYDPATDTWRALALSPLRAKSQAAGVWTGRFFLVIGGGEGGKIPVPGPGSAAYDPATDTWTVLPTAPPYPPPAPSGPTGPADQRFGASGFWSGTSALVIGGQDGVFEGRSDGLAWTPDG